MQVEASVKLCTESAPLKFFQWAIMCPKDLGSAAARGTRVQCQRAVLHAACSWGEGELVQAALGVTADGPHGMEVPWAWTGRDQRGTPTPHVRWGHTNGLPDALPTTARNPLSTP